MVRGVASSIRAVTATPALRRGSAIAAACLLATGLAACGSEDAEETAPETTPAVTAPTTTESSAEETTTSETPTSTTTSSTSTRASSAASSTNESRRDGNIEQARERFGALAPDSLFEAFETCAPNGLEDSVACSGPTVGQFQFFASDSNAASSTQVLTELRSSRVMEDTGSRVVGWSTLGNTAVITVVENDEGLVMKQMVSIDEKDPKKLIEELGLVGFQRERQTSEPTAEAEETDK